MKRYLEEVKNRIGSLEVIFVQIPKGENEYADRLAKAALAEFMLVPKQVLSFVQVSSLIDNGTNVQEVNSESNWTMPLISYLKTGVLPNGNDAARKLKGPSITICADKRCFIQKRVLPTIPEVSVPRRSRLRNERSP